MVPYFLANYKTKKLKCWQLRGGEGRQILYPVPGGNRECRDGPWRAWWLHFNGQIKNQCPLGRCTYFVLKLSKRNCMKENKRKTNKEKTVDRTLIVRMEMATMPSGDGRRSLNPINLHKLVTFRVQQLLVNIWSRCRRLCSTRWRSFPPKAKPNQTKKKLAIPCGLTIILTSNSRMPRSPRARVAAPPQSDESRPHRTEISWVCHAMVTHTCRGAPPRAAFMASGLPLVATWAANWASFVSATRAATPSVVHAPKWALKKATTHHLVNVHWDLIVKQLVYRKSFLFLGDLHFGNVVELFGEFYSVENWSRVPFSVRSN